MVPRNLADADLARMNEIPVDWGIEIGVLAEVFRNCSTRRICQVDLCQKYEHRHRPLSPGDPSTGMFKMAIDIARTLFSTLAAEGVVLTEKFFKTLKVTYLRAGNVAIDKYNDEPLSTAFPLIGIRRVSPLRPFSRQSILQASLSQTTSSKISLIQAILLRSESSILSERWTVALSQRKLKRDGELSESRCFAICL